jgi:hypothetical protein
MLFLEIDRFSDHFFEELGFFLFLLPGEDGLLNSFLDNLSMFGLEDFFFGFLKFVDSGENGDFGAVGFGLGLDEREGSVDFSLHGM